MHSKTISPVSKRPFNIHISYPCEYCAVIFRSRQSRDRNSQLLNGEQASLDTPNLYRAVPILNSPKIHQFLKGSFKMTITVIGHLCLDVIDHADGTQTHSHGGIFFSLATLANLLGEKDTIYPV